MSSDFTWAKVGTVSGEWDQTTSNWSSNLSGNLWTNGNHTAIFSGNGGFSVTLTENITLNRLLSTYQPHNSIITFGAGTPLNLIFDGTDPLIAPGAGGSTKAYLTIASPLSISATDLIFDENPNDPLLYPFFTIQSNNATTWTGTVFFRQGTLILDGASADATGVEYWRLENHDTTLILQNTNGNVLSDQAKIVLDGGWLRLDKAETVGDVILGSYSEIEAGASGLFTMGNLIRPGISSKTGFLFHTNSKTLRLNNNPYGTQLLPWIITPTGEYGQFDAAGNLGVITPTDNTNLSNWTNANTSYRLTGSTFSGNIPTGSVNTISFQATDDTNATIPLDGALTLTSGALSLVGHQNNCHWTLTGGSIQSGTGELTFGNIDNRAGARFIIESVITGNNNVTTIGGLDFNGDGIHISGNLANTYTGTFFASLRSPVAASRGTVLNKTAALAVTGDLVVEYRCHLEIGSASSNQISDTATVTVYGTMAALGETIGALSGNGTIYENLSISSGNVSPTNGSLYFDGNDTQTQNNGILTMQAGTGFEFDISTVGGSDNLIFIDGYNLSLDSGGHELILRDHGAIVGPHDLMIFYDASGNLSDTNKPSLDKFQLVFQDGLKGYLVNSEVGKITYIVPPKGTILRIQ